VCGGGGVWVGGFGCVCVCVCVCVYGNLCRYMGWWQM